MTVACSTASFGSYVQVRHSATCQRTMGHTRLATIASCAGDRLVSGTRLWKAWPPLAMARYRRSIHPSCVYTMKPCIAGNRERHMGRSRGGGDKLMPLKGCAERRLGEPA